MTITLHGIKNCDSVKKAQKWFQQHQIEYSFHDFRMDGIDSSWLADVETRIGWQVLLNKRSTTYRQLDDNTKATMNREFALTLMLEQPTLIKRPVICSDKLTLVGFKTGDYEAAFNL
jgi:Spx/MgsR family transcriptional regulator